MKSVGEVMAIGRTFKQALGKGIRSLETGKSSSAEVYDEDLIAKRLITPNPDRLGYIRFALESGYTAAQIHEMTKVDPWFLRQMAEIVAFDQELKGQKLETVSKETLLRTKREGFSDARLARLWNSGEIAVRSRPKELGVSAVFNRVDTCAAEFESFTPYLYSSYESE